MYSIYCALVKCTVELHSFKDFDLKSFVKQQVIFYTNMFNYVFKDNHRIKIMQKYKESICKTIEYSYVYVYMCSSLLYV